MSPIRVAIADDHPIVREGLRRVIDTCAGLEVAGQTASNGYEAVELCARERPDVLLLDVSMPGPGFLETLHQLKRESEQTAVLVLSMHSEQVFGGRALEAGASGYVSKLRSPEILAEAIRTVSGGGRFFDPASSEAVARTRRTTLESRLSAREFQVFLMLGEGMRVNEIATVLDLSPKTVSTHRARILEKTRLADNAAIVRYVAALALLD